MHAVGHPSHAAGVQLSAAEAETPFAASCRHRQRAVASQSQQVVAFGSCSGTAHFDILNQTKPLIQVPEGLLGAAKSLGVAPTGLWQRPWCLAEHPWKV